MECETGVRIWFPEYSNIGKCFIGEETIIHYHCWIGDGVIIGRRCRIEAFCFIPPGVIIQDDCFIGPRVTFTNDKYPPSKAWLPTIVMKGASIGASCTILPGITIGVAARIGAGSLVTKNIPCRALAYGSPATVREVR